MNTMQKGEAIIDRLLQSYKCIVVGPITTIAHRSIHISKLGIDFHNYPDCHIVVLGAMAVNSSKVTIILKPQTKWTLKNFFINLFSFKKKVK